MSQAYVDKRISIVKPFALIVEFAQRRLHAKITNLLTVRNIRNGIRILTGEELAHSQNSV